MLFRSDACQCFADQNDYQSDAHGKYGYGPVSYTHLINDLATLKPLLAQEWSEKNELKPTEVSVASHKKIIWKCKHGHEWEAIVKSRTVNGTGFPYCSHNKVLAGFNDLASQYPDIAAEWSDSCLLYTSLQGCSEDIVIFRADGGNHFTDYGIYEGMFLFFDRKKRFKKGRLSCCLLYTSRCV